jgi:DNA-binding transcriptional LysR family regulator
MATSPLSRITLSRKLKLNQLMVFERVLELGSFVRAANEMGLTQPAVSKAIYELECFFDEPLFSRSNRGVVPTDFGTMLGRRAKSLIAELRYMAEEVNTFRTGEVGHVIVGTLISAAAELLPRTITKLKQTTSGILVTVREGTPPHLFPSLATGDLDIVVGRLPEKSFQIYNDFPLKHEVLYKETFCVVVGRAHPMAKRRNLKTADLLLAEWILPLPESPSRYAAERLFHSEGLSLPTHQVESLSLLANLGLLIQTETIAFMPRTVAMQFVKLGLISILDLSTVSDFGEVGFSIRADKESTPSCQKFIRCLREVAATANR